MYMGNTTDIKLADRFSRAVNFFFFDKVTQLAGWQVVFVFFFQNKDKNKYARRCAYYLMHTKVSSVSLPSLYCRFLLHLHFHSLNRYLLATYTEYYRQRNYNLLATHLGFFFSLKALNPIFKFSPSFNALPYRLSVL